MEKPVIRLRVDSTEGLAGVYIADQIVSNSVSCQRKVNRGVGMIQRNNQFCRAVSIVVDRDEIDQLVDDSGQFFIHPQRR